MQPTNEVAFYLAAARCTPKLGREEEADLARRWASGGDRRAANLLARAHQRQVVAIAIKYRHYGLPVGELVAEGNLGVVRALAKFQPERGVRFATYANYWVRAQMLAHVISSHSAVLGTDGPLNSKMFFKLRRERVRVANQFGTGEAAERVLAERLGVSQERVRSMLQRLDCRDVPLDHGATANDPAPLERLGAPAEQEDALGRRQAEQCIRVAVDAALAALDPRERYIARHRLMADAAEALSLSEIGRLFKVSRERARQLETRAKAKLRRLIDQANSPMLKEWLASELTTGPNLARVGIAV